MINVENYLKTNGIEYIKHEHVAVYTTHEADDLHLDIAGLSCKNLFLRSKKENKYYLVILPHTKSLDMKKFGDDLGGDRFTFASYEELKDILGLEAGSVSPFGLLNDINHIVNVYIDKAVYEVDIVGFHPNRNTATLELTNGMFHKYLGLLNNSIKVMEL